ncbi:hypothetical protein M595_5562 [Lyngbya aestuarii BL J]|uniref:Uncharacterized protein n=1 Tax=Lyngbya aestuarii BL J TaxID=1348334 RepID=U7Q9K6_9CYAN|nr:hypothetical protein [Lyngbya aestuarii]ERT04494.1 hypothetical protein M595_5562 [Lyngbya aestuarii BL J]
MKPFSFLTDYRPVFCQSQPQEYQSYIEIAVDVLQVQNQAKLEILKNFLLSLPSLTEIENVLAEAVHHLAQTDPQTYRWIIQHPDYLMPELDLTRLAQQLALSKLKNSPLILGEDFRLTRNGQLRLSDPAKKLLQAETSFKERLLFTEFLQADCLSKS